MIKPKFRNLRTPIFHNAYLKLDKRNNRPLHLCFPGGGGHYLVYCRGSADALELDTLLNILLLPLRFFFTYSGGPL